MTSPALTCNRCGKKLSRKRARLIDGEIVCSPCMFAPRDSGRQPKAEDAKRLSGEAMPERRCEDSASPN